MNEPTKIAPCPELEQDLVLWHYGELSGAQRQRVESHLGECAACTRSLTELGDLVVQTLLSDAPPQDFWNNYSRELRHKLAQLDEPKSWRQKALLWLRPFAMPALATSAMLALALTFSLSKPFWQEPERPAPIDDAILEVLPMAENLDLLDILDVLDDLELLEQMRDQDAA